MEQDQSGTHESGAPKETAHVALTAPRPLSDVKRVLQRKQVPLDTAKHAPGTELEVKGGDSAVRGVAVGPAATPPQQDSDKEQQRSSNLPREKTIGMQLQFLLPNCIQKICLGREKFSSTLLGSFGWFRN